MIGLTSLEQETLLQYLKNENWVFNYVWFSFSELLLSFKSNSGWSYNS